MSFNKLFRSLPKSTVLLLLILIISPDSSGMNRRTFLEGLLAGIVVQSSGLNRISPGLNEVYPSNTGGYSAALRDVAEIRNVLFDFYNGPNQGNISLHSVRNYIDSLRALDLRSDRVRLIRDRQIFFIEERVLAESRSPSPLIMDIALARSLLPISLLRKINSSIAFEANLISLSQREYETLNHYGRMLVILSEIYSLEDRGFRMLSNLYEDHFETVWPRVTLASPGLCELQFF